MKAEALHIIAITLCSISSVIAEEGCGGLPSPPVCVFEKGILNFIIEIDSDISVVGDEPLAISDGLLFAKARIASLYLRFLEKPNLEPEINQCVYKEKSALQKNELRMSGTTWNLVCKKADFVRIRVVGSFR